MSLIRDLVTRDDPLEARSISTVDDYITQMNQFTFQGLVYGGGIEQTLAGGPTERIPNDYIGVVREAYMANGVIFACILVRRLVFSGIRFTYQRLNDGKPSRTYGDTSLSILERPWVGGTTQDLLNRIFDDAELAGNAYFAREDTEIIRLRPDWVDIVVEKRMRGDRHLGYKKVGYLYTEGGRQSGNEPVPFLVEDVAHFCPIPDPLANFRGMSWMTPIARELQADQLMTRHRSRFFQNGATPNMVIKHPAGADERAVKRFKEMLEEEHAGTDNAYKTLHLYPGADLTVVGSSFEQADFKNVQGAGETRIAAAAGVPPVIVGLSEGLQAATYSNYGQARRRFADGTMHPLWSNVSGSLEILMPNQGPGVRLWYDAKGVPFLREDEMDAATIAETQARTIRTLVDGGYTPESALAAVQSGDWGLLEHTGLFSVQLRVPGTTDPQPVPTDQPDPAQQSQGV